jgi:hypothetical protein
MRSMTNIGCLPTDCISLFSQKCAMRLNAQRFQKNICNICFLPWAVVVMDKVNQWNQLATPSAKAMDIEYLTKPMLDSLRWIAANNTMQATTRDMRIQFLMLKGFIRLGQPQGYYITEKGRTALELLEGEAEAPRLH